METIPLPLAALDARIEREILRLRARYELSLDEFRGLYISDEQVDRLIAASPAGAYDVTSAIERPATIARATDDRWDSLARTFDLSRLDEDLLLIAAAPELDPKYETLYAYLNNDITRKWPTVDLAQRLLADVETRSSVLAALSPGAVLSRQHLIQRLDGPAGRSALLSTAYAARPPVMHWLYGHDVATAFQHGPVTWSLDPSIGYDVRARAWAAPIVRLIGGWAPGDPALPSIALLGQPGAGRTATASAVAVLTSRPLVRIDVRALAEADGDAAGVLEDLHVALALTPSVVLVDALDENPEEDGKHVRIDRRFARAAAEWPASTLIVIRANAETASLKAELPRRIVRIQCNGDSFEHRLSDWRDAAGAQEVRLPDADLHSLAGRFALTPGYIRDALSTARDLSIMQGSSAEPSIDQVAAAARQTSDQALGRLAAKIERKSDWPDLVLPVHTLRRLRELAAAIRHRHVVFGEWGFAERIINGTGVKALFAGASGTGKTMAAGVIARELGLDLYKIDLSGVVSKYIGETEKNLDRIFRAARSSNAIVFLDEAEAIMGKRSEVKDAHDRYANIEVAYLLQRLEDHDGIVILATNLRKNIDDAFNRRMHYVIDFPRPEEAERERIWRLMFPARSPLGADVDFAFLARQFDLAGGDIRNVVLDAAFLAAQAGGTIDMRVIVEALTRQLAKQGKTPTGTDFRQYQRLLPAGGRQDGR